MLSVDLSDVSWKLIVEHMEQMSRLDDSKLTLPNGQSVTRETFEIVFQRVEAALLKMEMETGKRPHVPDITARVAVDNDRYGLTSEPHADVVTGYYLGEEKVCCLQGTMIYLAATIALANSRAWQVAIKRFRYIKAGSEKDVLVCQAIS